MRIPGPPLLAGVVLIGPAICPAQTPPADGFTWLQVGSPGNRAPTPAEAPLETTYPRAGAVGYTYWITQTEVTVSQWLEFVQAYSPYYTGSRGDSGFTSDWIYPSTVDPNQPPGYYIVPGAQNYPANMSWRMAARYVNWLQNDKRPDQSAFESGAYDTSTFVTHPDGTSDDQIARSPGARFAIPTRDEWAKAVYYDPSRYGAGADGYWLYPNMTNSPLVPGLPEDGGQTMAGVAGWFGFPVGQYPQVQTPWGLLDASGGNAEWTEGITQLSGRVRELRGSYNGDPLLDYEDRLDQWGESFPFFSPGGLRIVGLIPGPGTCTLLVLPAAVSALRRRRDGGRTSSQSSCG